MLKRILRRIYVSPEESVMEMILEHASLCKRAVQLLEEVLKLAVKGEVSERGIMGVEKAEREADKLRRAILDQLAEGALPPLSREDFVRLAERVDMIADWSREACRVMRAISDPSRLAKVGKPLLDLASYAREAAEKLFEALQALNTDLERARELIAEVERIEDRGDWTYAECLALLSRSWSEINDPLVLILVEDVENVVDASEDASDVLEEIIVRALR